MEKEKLRIFVYAKGNKKMTYEVWCQCNGIGKIIFGWADSKEGDSGVDWLLGYIDKHELMSKPEVTERRN